MRFNNRAFTLIELIIVVIIIGILAAISGAMMDAMTKKAIRTEAYAALAAIREASREYRMEYGIYPTVVFNLSTQPNPLSEYLPPGSLDGAYFSANCYCSGVVGLEDLNNAITKGVDLHNILATYGATNVSECMPVLSHAPNFNKVATIGNIIMLPNGQILDLDDQDTSEDYLVAPPP